MTTLNYGNFYWCVKVPQEISPSSEIYLNAEKAEVTPNGDLIFWSSTHENRTEPFQNLSLARGSWLVFFAASQIDGSAVAVEHWEGEVIRGH